MAYQLYPFDPTGSQESNLIPNELHTVIPPDWREHYFIVPRHAPFFKEGLIVVHRDTNRVLVDGVDFTLGYEFMEASKATATPVYGCIVIINREIAGVLDLRYQSIGGDFAIDSTAMLQMLSDLRLNPKISTWDSVANPPYRFPVVDHQWHIDDMTRVGDVIGALDRVTAAILDSADSGGSGGGSVGGHVLDFSNPHRVTKHQVELGNQINWGPATNTQILAGVSDNTYMNVTQSKQFLDHHILNEWNVAKTTPNYFGVTKADIGLQHVQNFPVATDTQLIEGTSEQHYLVVKNLVDYMQLLGVAGMADHFTAENPHNINLELLGIPNVPNWSPGTVQAAELGMSQNMFMSPKLTRDAMKKVIEESTFFNFATWDQWNALPNLLLDSTRVVNLTLLRQVANAIAVAAGDIGAHLAADNPHNITKETIGLDKVENFSPATKEESADGVRHDLYVTPEGIGENNKRSSTALNFRLNELAEYIIELSEMFALPEPTVEPTILTFLNNFPVRISMYLVLEPDQHTTIDWGDGNVETFTYQDFQGFLSTDSNEAIDMLTVPDIRVRRTNNAIAAKVNHTLVDIAPDEEVDVKITGYFGTYVLNCNDVGWRANFKDVKQWGETKILALDGLFGQCESLSPTLTATDAPNFIMGATLRWLNGLGTGSPLEHGLGHWDVTNVVSMVGMLGTAKYKGSLASWRPVNVIDITSIFQNSQELLTLHPDTFDQWDMPNVRLAISVSMFNPGVTIPTVPSFPTAILTYGGQNGVEELPLTNYPAHIHESPTNIAFTHYYGNMPTTWAV